MTTLNIYLTFNGNCLEAFEFYQSVFGGEYASLSRFSEMPPQDGMPPIPEEDQDKIMHMSLPISDGHVLMGSDTAEAFGGAATIGTNFTISVNPDNKQEADRIFEALSKGGEVTMPMQDTFWDSYFGSFKDKYSINWMVSVDLQQH